MSEKVSAKSKQKKSKKKLDKTEGSKRKYTKKITDNSKSLIFFHDNAKYLSIVNIVGEDILFTTEIFGDTVLYEKEQKADILAKLYNKGFEIVYVEDATSLKYAPTGFVLIDCVNSKTKHNIDDNEND